MGYNPLIRVASWGYNPLILSFLGNFLAGTSKDSAIPVAN